MAAERPRAWLCALLACLFVLRQDGVGFRETHAILAQDQQARKQGAKPCTRTLRSHGDFLPSVLNHVCCAIVTTKPDFIKDPTTATACIHGMSNEAKNQILSCSL